MLVSLVQEKHDHRLEKWPTGQFLNVAPLCWRKTGFTARAGYDNWMRSLIAVLVALIIPASAVAHGVSAADKELMAIGGHFDYIWLGAVHMITGYDHLLFLFGVVFFLTTFKEIIKFVTAFTIGHSVTLIGATFAGVTANYYLVDAVIALTVCYKGFDNLDGFKRYFGINSPNLLGMVLGFGLIHGFGLSTRLQQLPLGDDGLLLKIISFNVGVEIGQVGALIILVGFLNIWRKTESFSKLSTVSNIGLIIAGVFLLVMQIDGYVHDYRDDEHGHHEALQHPVATPEPDSAPGSATAATVSVTRTTVTEPVKQEPHTHSHGSEAHTHGTEKNPSHEHSPAEKKTRTAEEQHEHDHKHGHAHDH